MTEVYVVIGVNRVVRARAELTSQQDALRALDPVST
jgi:hypothetical protein